MGKFTDAFFRRNEETQEDVNSEEIDLEELLRGEIIAVMEELAYEHSDSEKYSRSVHNLESLLKAYSEYKRGDIEAAKLALQLAEARKKQMVNWDLVLPKIAAVMVSGGVTLFWICLEQQRPLPMRLVQAVNSWTTPKGL